MNDKRIIFDVTNNIELEIELTNEEQAAWDRQKAAGLQAALEFEAKLQASQIEENSLKAKAAATLATEATVTSAVKDKDMQTIIKSLLARIEYLEKRLGVDHTTNGVTQG